MAAVTCELARYAVESRFEDLPEAVRHEGEHAVVNILAACSVAPRHQGSIAFWRL